MENSFLGFKICRCSKEFSTELADCVEKLVIFDPLMLVITLIVECH